MKLFLVFNPVAGSGDHETLLQDLKKIIKNQSLDCNIYTTTGNDDAQYIEKKLATNDYTRIVAAGGDGTVSEVAKYSRNYNIPLGILPIGTSNGLATDLCIPNEPLNAFQLIIDSDESINLDTVIVNENYPFIHLGDIGANANLLAKNENTSNGKIQSALNAFEELKEGENFNYKIITDDGEWEGNANMVSFCNAKRYGTGIPLTKQGKPNDGLFELVIFKEIKVTTLLNSALATIDPTFLDENHKETIITDSANINLTSPQLMQLDGELIDTVKHIQLKIGKEKTTVICNKDCPYL